jgi:hypothetical protein
MYFQHPSCGKLPVVVVGLPTMPGLCFQHPSYGKRVLCVPAGHFTFNTHSRETMPEVRWGVGGGNTTFNTHSRKSSSCCRIVCYAYHALPTPFSWETVPNSLIFYYPALAAEPPFQNENFSLLYLGVYDTWGWPTPDTCRLYRAQFPRVNPGTYRGTQQTAGRRMRLLGGNLSGTS